jgi:HlyD family secretion protein
VVLSVPRRTGAAVSPEGPILFLLSAPLDVLWLEAPVGEADIGRLRVGQASRFEVQAFPGEVLPATIEQIGVLGDVEGSVARYPVRLTAPNPRGRLRPGMSAAVRFAVAEETKALAVREVALRFEPPGAPEAPPRSRVFVRTEPGRLEPVEVEAGISDGVYAVVTPVEDGALEPGDEVAIGLGTLNGHGRGPGLSLGGK